MIQDEEYGHGMAPRSTETRDLKRRSSSCSDKNGVKEDVREGGWGSILIKYWSFVIGENTCDFQYN